MVTVSPATPPFTALGHDELLRLWPLAVHARHLLAQLRFVDYHQAEQDAALLAQQLLSRYTPAELGQMAFYGLPRGGLIVLGLLAYQLDLRPQQLQPASPDGFAALCLVDDCALTGNRLVETLMNVPHDRVVIAALYAAAGLYSAVQQQFPHVETCLAAHFLAEKPGADLQHGDELRLQEFLADRLYAAPLELVAFAWNEPDFIALTPFDVGPSQQWRFLPPHQCGKNRQALDLPPRPAAELQWIVPQGIVYGWHGGVLYLLDTRREEVFRLDGLAADSWRALAGYGSTVAALAYLRRQYARVAPSALQESLETNLAAFRRNDLLQAVSPDSVQE